MLENVLTALKRGKQFTLFCKYVTLLMNFCMYKYSQRLIIKARGGKKSLKITIPAKSFVLINVTLYSIPPRVMLNLKKCKTVN